MNPAIIERRGSPGGRSVIGLAPKAGVKPDLRIQRAPGRNLRCPEILARLPGMRNSITWRPGPLARPVFPASIDETAVWKAFCDSARALGVAGVARDLASRAQWAGDRPGHAPLRARKKCNPPMSAQTGIILIRPCGDPRFRTV